MFKKLKELFVKKPDAVKKEPKVKKTPELSAKEKATQAKEPYVNVIRMEVDPENVHEGAFELDWNEFFIAKLVKTGYMKDKADTDQDIIDRWFQDICRTIVLEMYEQVDADPSNRDVRNVRQRNLGGGRTEVS